MHLWRWTSGQRSVVMFPSELPWDPASNLRAWLLAPELRRRGWRVVLVPQPLSLAQRNRILSKARPDVVLMQQTRHLLNDPKLYPGYQCVLDIDDADYLDPRHRDRIGSACAAAAGIIAGSTFIAELLRPRTRGPVTVVWTGTPARARRQLVPNSLRAPIVAWAHSAPLTYPTEAKFVHDVMAEVMRRMRCEFWLFGTREDEAADWFRELRSLGGTCKAIPGLPYADYLAKVAEAAVGLQPVCTENLFSNGKSFGKILAYLDGHVGVVATDAVDHPLFFSSGVNGVLEENDVNKWATHIVHLLENPELREKLAFRAWRDFQERLTTSRAAELVDAFLRQICEQSRVSQKPG
jgi:hypothetical protein